MRIGCLQFSPQVGDVDRNLTRADRVLSRGNTEDLDLIVLPEMAFSGYNFKSLAEIHPSLEPTGAGISSLWARTTALKYNCHVAVGYPETTDISHKWPADPEYYNAAIVVGPDGENVAHYRKTHLYYTDQTWALEGNHGFYGDHITGLGQTAIGICMDINPYKFEAPWDKFEFAYHVLSSDANLVIVSMAWLTLEDQGVFNSLPSQEPDMSTLTYWAMRLEPVIRAETKDEIIVVFCNRCGAEGDTLYAGSSAVLGIKDGEVNVYGLLGRGEKKLLVVDTNQAPVAKLVMTGMGMKLMSSGSGPGESSAPQTNPSRSSPKPRGDDQRARAGSHEGARDRGSTPSRTKGANAMTEAVLGPQPSAFDSPRQALLRLAPFPSAQHNSPSQTPDGPRKKQTNPPVLTIPDTSSRSWRKTNDANPASTPLSAMVGTPTRKMVKDPSGSHSHSNSPRPASRVPGSAVVASSVGRHRDNVFSPQDSAIGRATPETAPRKSSRRSGDSNPSRHKEVGLKLNTVVPEKVLQGEDEAAWRARTLKDSPVARRPNSSVLTHWLETLPQVADLAPVPGTSPAQPRPPSTLTRGEETPSGSPICHACGQGVPAGSGAVDGSEVCKTEKKPSSKKAVSGNRGPRVEGESNPLHSSRDRGDVTPLPPNPSLKGAGVEWVPDPADENGGGRFQRAGLARVEEFKDEDALPVLQPHVFVAAPNPGGSKPRELNNEGVDEDVLVHISLQQKEVDGPNAGSLEKADKGNHVMDGSGDHKGETPLPEEISPQKDKSTTDIFTAQLPAKPEPNGVGDRDPLAPRTGIVPPPLRELQRVVAVSARPTSVAW
ncbi:uncharacterized protein DNG_01167 [Cephalotrichum gorgonifer]|uniref:CN hydrolase domain-containing protein n=1 Tax=Cephalotrichum gorgonifer TaxID=2041049 RepID=A0AAE8MRD2_9PEZI|nr:uncharacterized protein DNG_01167 [Cephalotrichum gorgonifer]